MECYFGQKISVLQSTLLDQVKAFTAMKHKGNTTKVFACLNRQRGTKNYVSTKSQVYLTSIQSYKIMKYRVGWRNSAKGGGGQFNLEKFHTLLLNKLYISLKVGYLTPSLTFNKAPKKFVPNA